MIQTEHYLRFERVASAEETERGLLAALQASGCGSTSCATTSSA